MKKLVVLLLVVVGWAYAGYLDLGELNDVQYSIQILETPVALTPDEVETPSTVASVSGGAVTMVNKFGQKYLCQLPSQSEVDSGGVEGGATTAAPVDVSSLLAPLNTAPCIVRTKDWWTYEVCFGRKITQYHVENDRPVGPIIQLGNFNADKNDESKDLTYHPQWYTNGSRCDLTGKPRQTELRFVCNEAAVNEFIGDIFEPQSCEYTMVVFTDKTCSVPHLRPPRESAPLEITCRPLLTASQLAEYERYSQLKAKKAEIKLKQMKERQKKLESMLSGKGGTDMFSLFTAGLGDKIISELGAMMGSALQGQATMKVVDIDSSKLVTDLVSKETAANAAAATSSSEPTANTTPAPSESSEAAVSGDGWNLVHRAVKKEVATTVKGMEAAKGTEMAKVTKSVQKIEEAADESKSALQEERIRLLRKMQDSRRLLKRFVSQLHDTETFIKESLEQEPAIDSRILETLELQKQQLEMLITKTRESIIEWETQVKDIGSQIIKLQNKPTSMEKLEKDLHELSKEVEEKMKNMGENLEQLEKVKEVLKGDISNQFTDILKEAAAELHMDQADFQEGEVLDVMKTELDNLLSRLGKSEKGVDSVQKQLYNVRDSMNAPNLKRDGKKSVKKELREPEENTKMAAGKEGAADRKGAGQKQDSAEEKGDTGDKEDDNRDKTAQQILKESKEQLDTIESELDQVEKGLAAERAKMGGVEKLAIKLTQVTSLTGGEDAEDIKATDLQNTQMVKKLETTIKKRLEKLGLETGGRPIEIKVITTSIPMSEEEGLEGDDAGHYESMVFNLLTGNQQGYQDADSQRKTAKNYRFSWDPLMVGDMETELKNLQEAADTTSSSDSLYDISEEKEPRKEAGKEDLFSMESIFGVRESHQRPSSGIDPLELDFERMLEQGQFGDYDDLGVEVEDGQVGVLGDPYYYSDYDYSQLGGYDPTDNTEVPQPTEDGQAGQPENQGIVSPPAAEEADAADQETEAGRDEL